MRIAETLNEGLKREYSVTIPAKDLAAKIDAQVASFKQRHQARSRLVSGLPRVSR